MADKKISELVSITGSATAADDYFVVVDTSGAVTYKISREELNNAIEQDVLSSIEITDITNDVNVQGTVTADGLTISENVSSPVGITINNPSGSTNGDVILQFTTPSVTTTIGIDATGTDIFKISNSSALGTSDVLAIDSSGNVGIGTSSPVSKLDLASGNITISNSTNAPYINFVENTTRSQSLSRITMDQVSGTAGQLLFSTTTGGTLSEAMRITSTGNVGIGDSAPSAKLVLRDSSDFKFVMSKTGASAFEIANNGTSGTALTVQDPYPLIFGTHNTERMRITSTGELLVGTTSDTMPAAAATGQAIMAGTRTFIATETGGDTILGGTTGSNFTAIYQGGSEKMRIGSTGNVGIGTTSPSELLHIKNASGDAAVRIDGSTRSFKIEQNNYGLRFADVSAGSAERLRITAGGDLLVGTTDTVPSNNGAGGDAGVAISPDGVFRAARSSNVSLDINRMDTNGDIAAFRKDGSTVGGIGTNGSGRLCIGSGDTGLDFEAGNNAIRPCSGSSGAARDNAIDLGRPDVRFDDIYATNGTIQTSDQNEKQQIAALTDAEMTAAKAISALFKTFKWNSAVTEKGDAARTHAGVIAQDVQAAMTAAGLDAGDYAFFISSTWYVDADGNEVEADAEGAIEKNRKGIRYPELLAFVGAATEQRLASIETRLAALEAN